MREYESSVYKLKGFILNNKLKLYCLIFYNFFFILFKVYFFSFKNHPPAKPKISFLIHGTVSLALV